MNNNKSTEEHIEYRPLISVIMNCFNGEKFVKEAINSVLRQTYQNWEIIFWDNQSDDLSAKIVKSYNDHRIKYYYAPFHTLLYEARNYACERANGSLLSFLDVDDLWLPEKLEQQVLTFTDPEIIFSYANYYIDELGSNKRRLAFKSKTFKKKGVNNLLHYYNVGLLTLIIRRSSLPYHIKLFNPRYNIIGDFDLVIRLAAHMKFSSIEEPLAVYRIHGSNESIKRRDMIISELEYWINEKNINFIEVNAISKRSLEAYLNYHKTIQELSALNRFKALTYINKMPWCYLKIKMLYQLVTPEKLMKHINIIK